MDGVSGTASVSALMEKLSALETRFSDLEVKYNSLANAQVVVTTPMSPTAATDGKKKSTGSAVALDRDSEKDQKHDEAPVHRVKVVISKRDQDGEPIESEAEPQKAKDEDNSKHAFILKRIVYDKFSSNNENESEIDIINLGLWNLLKEHLGWYPYHKFRESPVTLFSPFEPIIFCWDELTEAAAKKAKDDEDKQAREDLQLLLDTISGGSSGDVKLDKYFKMRPTYKNSQVPTVQFTDLWTIFTPGTLVYGKPFQNEDQVFVVKDNRGSWPRKDPRPGTGALLPWQLDAWSYDWKAGSFGRVNFILTFEHFEGHLPYTSLPFYPFEMHPEHQRVRKNLIARGKIFQKLCKAREGEQMFEYKGYAIPEKKGFSGLRLEESVDNDDDFRSRGSTDLLHSLMGLGRPRRPLTSVTSTAQSSNVKSRVMVDYASYFQYGLAEGRNGSLRPSDRGAECGCSDCQINEGLVKRYRKHFDKNAKKREWEDEQYLICPPRVLGYILQEKQWAQLQVSRLREIAHENITDSWTSRLKLANEDTKKLLFDLVRSHSSPTTPKEGETKHLEVDDIVPGKGKGLVILLYGPPGVGKTSTAETIAVAARKPLFSVSVADVGTQAKNVESNLSMIFSLATSWQAILLIDEADVFLESRGRGAVVQSTDKNALVSVFLRVLEYYQGIMFLTTNQIAEFDIAIPSRIHIAIQYRSLVDNQMLEIFKGFLDKLDRDNFIDDYDEIMDWLKDDVFSEGFDGRQIRNIVTTALSLARAEERFGRGKGKLTKTHMKRAFNNVKEFKREFQTQMQRYKDSQMKMIK